VSDQLGEDASSDLQFSERDPFVIGMGDAEAPRSVHDSRQTSLQIMRSICEAVITARRRTLPYDRLVSGHYSLGDRMLSAHFRGFRDIEDRQLSPMLRREGE
jgi:hypothetical protein